MKEQAKIENFFSFKDKNKFWKRIAKSKYKSNAKKQISIPPDKLLNHFLNMFKEDESALSNEKQNFKTTVNDKFLKYSHSAFLPYFELDQIKKIISELDNSFVKGFDLISYALLKNINFQGFQELLLDFFNKIQNNFNCSKIVPILKDSGVD